MFGREVPAVVDELEGLVGHRRPVAIDDPAGQVCVADVEVGLGNDDHLFEFRPEGLRFCPSDDIGPQKAAGEQERIDTANRWWETHRVELPVWAELHFRKAPLFGHAPRPLTVDPHFDLSGSSTALPGDAESLSSPETDCPGTVWQKHRVFRSQDHLRQASDHGLPPRSPERYSPLDDYLPDARVACAHCPISFFASVIMRPSIPTWNALGQP